MRLLLLLHWLTQLLPLYGRPGLQESGVQYRQVPRSKEAGMKMRLIEKTTSGGFGTLWLKCVCVCAVLERYALVTFGASPFCCNRKPKLMLAGRLRAGSVYNVHGVKRMAA